MRLPTTQLRAGQSEQGGQVPTPTFSVLLEDPDIALWAKEAGSRYRISSLDALGVLAHALVVDARA